MEIPSVIFQSIQILQMIQAVKGILTWLNINNYSNIRCQTVDLPNCMSIRLSNQVQDLSLNI
jgi:hypothetical protein